MRVLLGMSGGLDSTCAAKILIEEGHTVEGAVLVMHAFTEREAAKNAAATLGIPLHEVDGTERFRQAVQKNFAEEYLRGRTPNPCVVCNREVKFDVFLETALSLGADKVATGHYARLDSFKDENGKEIEIELYPDIAPISCENFEKLVKDGFYDGLIFHRVIEGFMIQGGDPEGTGMGGPGYTIKGEFSTNGVKNDLKHTRGVISMARSMHPNSAGSQFFIMHQDAPHLDGQYAAFGKVTSGLDVVDAIAKVQTNRQDRPLTEQKIASITVDTKGETYPEPNKLPDPYGRF